MEDLPIINVYYDPPPIPVPSLFWVACIFDECDEDSCEGRGATAEQAVEDFLSQLEDRGDNRQDFRIELGYPGAKQ